MNLTHRFLTEKVVIARCKTPLILGQIDDIITEDQADIFHSCHDLKVDENNEVWFKGEMAFKIYVNPANMNYEIELANGLKFDVAFDTDEELNQCVEYLWNHSDNELFSNKKLEKDITDTIFELSSCLKDLKDDKMLNTEQELLLRKLDLIHY
jgi:hypothetical protein